MQELVRKNIRALQPYSCARDEFRGREAHVFVDANESPFNTGYNRYPDPLQEEIKNLLAPIKNVHPDEIFLGNGSDEAIDLVYRVFCEPRVDNVVAMAPSYGMYEVCANINDVEYRKVLLDENFQLHADAMLSAADEHTKVMWICSPNNPTGNDMDRKEVKRLLDEFPGILVVDEAYIDFSSLRSLRELVRLYPRLIVLNTFSKAWASASVRLGIAFAQSEIIALFNKVKYPYNINLLTQQYALELLRNSEKLQRWTNDVKREREVVVPALKEVRNYLVDRGIVVRNRNNVQLCGNCLRITIGSKEENNEVLGALRSF